MSLNIKKVDYFCFNIISNKIIKIWWNVTS
nr:MAG TPA: hypothetical protein [Caudoviricetes sp.]